MKSIKPGRGPSFMSGIMSIAVGLFGVVWTVLAVSMGGGIFALFGVIFVIMAVAMAIYNFKNATSQNRYSSFDITEHGEENDPLNERFGRSDVQNTPPRPDGPGNTGCFCPYCGAKTESDFEYCSKCGKKLP